MHGALGPQAHCLASSFLRAALSAHSRSLVSQAMVRRRKLDTVGFRSAEAAAPSASHSPRICTVQGWSVRADAWLSKARSAILSHATVFTDQQCIYWVLSHKSLTFSCSSLSPTLSRMHTPHDVAKHTRRPPMSVPKIQKGVSGRGWI